jgi:hypothetical protein
LLLLGAGLVALSVSDSIFLYLVTTGAAQMPPLFNIGFLAGPVLIGLSARSAVWFTLLPYLPLGVVGLLVIVQQLLGMAVGTTERYGLTLLVLLVVTRQLLTLLENVDLLRRVQEGQDRLHHQAFHDWLTGLPNRALLD